MLSSVAYEKSRTNGLPESAASAFQVNYLKRLEAESIYILRETVAEFANPVMLYSIGKDSSVLLRLAQKAFFPAKIPFPLLHVDTSYKFKEMIEFRDSYTRQLGARLIVHTNQEALDDGVGCLQLAILPGHSSQGVRRGLLEDVRVASDCRSRGIGEQLVQWAVTEAARGCNLVELLTHQTRTDAQRFYKRLGFTASHVGMTVRF